MAHNKKDFTEYFEDHTLRLETSHRGGGIEVDASEFTGIEDLKMTAYQNYLGGGMTGSVQGCIEPHWHDGTKEQRTRAVELNEALKYYFYCLSNEQVANWDEWATSSSFEGQQNRPASAY